jgi:hypothetical protein
MGWGGGLPPQPGLSGVLALRVSLCGLVALFLCHRLMLSGPIFCRAFPLLRSPLAPHRGVTHQIPGRLLAPTEQLVEKSHLTLQLSGWERTSNSQYP